MPSQASRLRAQVQQAEESVWALVLGSPKGFYRSSALLAHGCLRSMLVKMDEEEEVAELEGSTEAEL